MCEECSGKKSVGTLEKESLTREAKDLAKEGKGLANDLSYLKENFNNDTTKEESENLNQTVSKSKKISRNAPCPCGSGKKFKHCCGSI